MERKAQKQIPQSEINRQNAFLAAIYSEWTQAFIKQQGKAPAYFIETYGCQMNERDSLHLKGMMEKAGWVESQGIETANFILYNTCCIREHAEARVFGNVGALHKRKAEELELLVGVCGCMMQQEETAQNLFKRFSFVDIVFGTHALYRFPELFYQVLMQKTRIIEIDNIDGMIAENLPSKSTGGVNNFVTIMFGCNNYCSFCIVPYVRGRERSRKPEDIIAEIEGMVAKGSKEIMLLGQNVNSYGKDIDDGIRFPELLRRVNDIKGLERIRFMSSHPKDLSDDLIAAMAQSEKVCRHFHLPVQSGSNRILEKMNRRYTVEQYLDRVKMLRAAMPDIELTTDIIVGFPGETEEDFQQTLALIDKVGYSTAFTFMYSPRNGTVAAKWEDQISADTKKERLLRLNELQAKKSQEINEQYMGGVYPVLIDGTSEKGKEIVHGKTDTFKTVYLPGDAGMIGSTVNVKITGARLNTLSGELV